MIINKSSGYLFYQSVASIKAMRSLKNLLWLVNYNFKAVHLTIPEFHSFTALGSVQFFLEHSLSLVVQKLDE